MKQTKKKNSRVKEKQVIKPAFWSGRQDSNLRPLAPHASALPGCATSRRGAANLQLYPLQIHCSVLVCKTTMTPERQTRIHEVLSKRQNNLTVVLENVFDPHNVSAIMRSCDAVGIQEIYVLNNRIPLHKNWGFKSSRSAANWISVHQYSDPVQCFEAVKNRYSSILTTHLSSDTVSLYQVDFTQSLALVFGNEKYGVSEEARALSDGSFIIPQVGMIRSLNISVACAVTIYEAFRQKSIAGHYDQRSLNEQAYNELSKQWGLINENNV